LTSVTRQQLFVPLDTKQSSLAKVLLTNFINQASANTQKKDNQSIDTFNFMDKEKGYSTINTTIASSK